MKATVISVAQPTQEKVIRLFVAEVKGNVVNPYKGALVADKTAKKGHSFVLVATGNTVAENKIKPVVGQEIEVYQPRTGNLWEATAGGSVEFSMQRSDNVYAGKLRAQMRKERINALVAAENGVQYEINIEKAAQVVQQQIAAAKAARSSGGGSNSSTSRGGIREEAEEKEKEKDSVIN